MDNYNLKFLGLSIHIEISEPIIKKLLKKYFPYVENGHCEEQECFIAFRKNYYLNNIDFLMKGRKRVNLFKGEYWYSSIKNSEYFLFNSENEKHIIEKADNKYIIYNLEDDYKRTLIWIVRCCREIILDYLMKKNYIPIHASAVEKDGKTICFFGAKGAGKSTSMFTFVDKQVYNIISNDMVFIKREKSEWKIVGWPWKITIGNSLIKKTSFDYMSNDEKKIEITPLKFCKLLNCHWTWEANLSEIYHVCVLPGEKLKENCLDAFVGKNLLLQEGIEYQKVYCIFNSHPFIPDYNTVFNKLINEFQILELKGDIWEYGGIPQEC